MGHLSLLHRHRADTAASDRDYGNGNLATAPASGNAGSGSAVVVGQGSQGLDYESKGNQDGPSLIIEGSPNSQNVYVFT